MLTQEARQDVLPPKRGTREFFRDLHPFEPMNPDAPIVPVNWLVPGFIMKGKINMVFGPEKSGKSRFLRWLLANMFLMKDVHNLTLQSPGRVLYLAGEETASDITPDLMNNVKLLGFDKNDFDWAGAITLVQAAGMRLDDSRQRDWIKQELISGNYDTLIIDPLRRVHAAKESSNDEMAYICNALRSWSNELGITIIVLHHTGKLDEEDDLNRIATWSRGATDLASVLDWAIFLTRQKHRVCIKRAGRAQPREDFHVYDNGGGQAWVEAPRNEA